MWGVRGEEVKVDAVVLAVTFRTCLSSAHWILPANLLPYLFYRWENRGIEKLSTSSDTPLVLNDRGTLWLSCVVPGSATLYTAWRCFSDHSYSKDSAVYNLEIRSLKGLPLVAGISRICVDEGISVFFFLTALVPPRLFPLWTCRWSWSSSLYPLHPSRCARMITLLLTCPLPLRVFTGCSDIMASGS